MTEEEIGKSIVGFMKNHHKCIEGAPGVSIASYMKTRDQYKGKNVGIIICGANIKTGVLMDLMSKYS